MSSIALRNDALAIWKAGLAAVDSERLVQSQITRTDNQLQIAGHRWELDQIGKIAVVGAGKAGAGMAAAFEAAVGDDLLDKRVSGWLNVPEDCVRPLRRIHLHGARPPGVNEPTAVGVEGTLRMLEMVSQLDRNDLCVVLLSGGGSALSPAPVEEISLEDKLQVTRTLMNSGASIDELNCVRKHLSRFKGGKLAQACTAGSLLALIISDVVGDPLETIASGPTVVDPTSDADALAILQRYAEGGNDIPASVFQYLKKAIFAEKTTAAEQGDSAIVQSSVHNVLIGNNDTALQAAAAKAGELGYRVHSLGSQNRGVARDEGVRLAELCLEIRDRQDPAPPPLCVLSGGEPVVHLTQTNQPRKGGRNQELVLAALNHLQDDGLHQLAIISGGTDGEDGPTDAAGAIADESVLSAARSLGLLPAEFLAINNSYPFFEQADGLLKTGPTHTNVMDLRVAVIAHPTL